VASIKENDVVSGVEVFFEVKGGTTNDIYFKIRENVTRIEFVTHLLSHIGWGVSERRKLGVYF
tara:strand:- start:99 stop:287 length:189 start_codon:yes stop_codon:yes gene_type:complete